MIKSFKSINIVILVSYTYPYKGSGIGNVAKNQAEELVKQGHNVTLISSNLPKDKSKFVYKGVTYIKLPAFDFLEKLHVPVPVIFFNLQSIKAIKNADVIHIHDFLYPSSLVGALLARLFKKKSFVTIHIVHVLYNNILINYLEKFVSFTVGNIILKLANCILVINSEFKKAPILKPYLNKVEYLPNGIEKKLFHNVSNSVKLKLRKKYGLSINIPIVLFVGRFVPKKGYNLLLNTNFEKALLILIGDTKDKVYKTNKNIRILGRKNKEELAEYFQLSDIFILPSHSEGFPLSVQEAMLSGLPVFVGKDNDYITSIGEKNIVTLDYSSEKITQKVDKYLKSPIELERMSNFSHAFSSKYFISWEENVKQLEKIYLKKD